MIAGGHRHHDRRDVDGQVVGRCAASGSGSISQARKPPDEQQRGQHQQRCCAPAGSRRGGGTARGSGRPRAARRAGRRCGCSARSRSRALTSMRGGGLGTGQRPGRTPCGPVGVLAGGQRIEVSAASTALYTLVQRVRPPVKRFRQIGRIRWPGSMLGLMWLELKSPRGFRAVASRLLAAPVGCSSDDSEAPAARARGRSTLPAARIRSPGQAYWVDSQGPAARQAARWRAQGRTQRRLRYEQLADAPDGRLAGRRERRRRARARGDRQGRAGRAGPRCSSPTTSPAATAAATRRAARAPRRPTAPGCARSPAASATTAGDRDPRARRDPAGGRRDLPLRAPSKAQRYALLADAVRRSRRRTVPRLPRRGQPRLRAPGRRLVAPLRASGIRAADGFALNVSNFYRTGHAIKLRPRALAPARRRPLRGRHEPQRQRPQPRTTIQAARSGATRRAARSAATPPRAPESARSTPTCGSSSPARATGPAARARRRRARGGPSTRWRWPATASLRRHGPDAAAVRRPHRDAHLREGPLRGLPDRPDDAGPRHLRARLALVRARGAASGEASARSSTSAWCCPGRRR